MQEEMNALNKNNTWDLMNLPDCAKVIDNKWVFRVKTDQDGSPVRL